MIAHYLALAFRPWPLVFDYYDWPAAHSPADVLPQALLAHRAVRADGVRGRASSSPLGFAGAWFFLTLAPTSSLLPIPTEIAAEHRMYVPLAAVVAVVVIGLLRCRAARSRRIARRPARDAVHVRVDRVVRRAGRADAREKPRLRHRRGALGRHGGEAAGERARADQSTASSLMKVEPLRRRRERRCARRCPLEMDPVDARRRPTCSWARRVAAQRRVDEGIASIERAVAIDPSIKTADADPRPGLRRRRARTRWRSSSSSARSQRRPDDAGAADPRRAGCSRPPAIPPSATARAPWSWPNTPCA